MGGWWAGTVVGLLSVVVAIAAASSSLSPRGIEEITLDVDSGIL